MKIKNIKKILASIGIFSLVAIVGISSLGMAMANDEEEPAQNYVSVTPNEFGGTHYEFLLEGGDDESTITLGYQIESDDYIYTYGYKWKNNGSTPTKGNLSNWAKVEENKTGWGVAVKNKNKSLYENVYDMINGIPVKYANNLFTGCTNLVTAPTISAFATDTTGMFSGCTNLKKVTLPNSLTTLGAGAFENCTALRHIFIPDSVIELADETAAKSVFSGCSSDLVIYSEYYDSYAELAYEIAINS